ncbi:MAG: hypothetical protein OHK93_004968 [Ramalina farinacea]|uniref:Mitochondrial outer membrane protein OM14 C-terminal domain-containing protein n=1 Tax=Ramalina farinacea TaxID=258253 RepID=A0AA43QV79_9LECA|nr:hypothetical protein [Ramalina farinacea]
MSYANAASKGPKQSPEDQAAEAADSTAQSAQDASSKAADTTKTEASKAESEASQKADQAKGKSSELASDAEKKFGKAKEGAKERAKAAEKGVKGEYNEVYDNRDNPVVIANALAITLGAVGLAYGGYTKHVKGELDWQLAGAAAAVVGVLGVGDYYLSQYLFKNKYPKK